MSDSPLLTLDEARRYLRSLGQWPRGYVQISQRPQYVYFVTCDIPDFPVKIGSAHDVEIRLKAHQTALPWPLQILLVIYGEKQKERELQDVFSDLRMRGEWFRRDHSLLKYIECAKLALPLSRRTRLAA